MPTSRACPGPSGWHPILKALCHFPANIPGQDGRGFEQLDLVEDVTAYCMKFRLDDL